MARALPCVEVVELLTAYLDGALPRRRRRAVTRHLQGCADCARLLGQLLDVVRRMKDQRGPGLRPTVRAALRTAFRSGVTDRSAR